MRVNKKKKLKEVSNMVTSQIELIERNFSQFNYDILLTEIDTLQTKFWEAQSELSVRDRLFLKAPYKNSEYSTGYEIGFSRFLRDEILNDELLRTYEIFNTQIELVENAISMEIDMLQLKCIDCTDDILIEQLHATYGSNRIEVDFVTGAVQIYGDEPENFYWDDFKVIKDGKFIGRKDVKQTEFLEKNLSSMFPSGKITYLKKCYQEIKEIKEIILGLAKSTVYKELLYRKEEFLMKLYNTVAACTPTEKIIMAGISL